MASESILHSDHEALKYIHSQHKLNSCHAKGLGISNFFMSQVQETQSRNRCIILKVVAPIPVRCLHTWF